MHSHHGIEQHEVGTSRTSLVTAEVLAVLLVGTALVTAGALATGRISAGVAVTISLAVVGAHLASARRTRPNTSAPVDAAALGHVVDKYRDNGVLTIPVAAIVVELRGIAADTLVDGPAAWSEPIGVIARRMTTADLGSGFSLARIGPHTFAAVLPAPDHAAAVVAAESLVALCRIPVQTPAREVRIDAVAGVGHADIGDRCNGEELVRMADAALRVDGEIASPVALADHRLLRHARKVIEVETEIRHSLDVDLLTARLIPVVDVRRDVMVGLRSGYDWTSVSSTDPDTLGSIAASLGLRRSIETQYLMRSIAAAESVPLENARRVVAQLDPSRLADPRAVGQIGLLLDVSGLDPRHLVLEFQCWGSSTLEQGAVDALEELGVGIGLSLRHREAWDLVPMPLVGRVDAVSVEAIDLLDHEQREVAGERVEQLLRMCDDDLPRVTVCGVDSAPSALELASVGLSTQCGLVHGRAMSAADLRKWVVNRAVG
jgi:predicted signal transduction protein with EAL and GGDEF domain